MGPARAGATSTASRACSPCRSATAAPSWPRRPASRPPSSPTSRSGPTPTPPPSSWPPGWPSWPRATSTGCSSRPAASEAVESAWKLARQYFKAIGQPGRYKVISRDIAYHGTSMGALAITGIAALRAPVRAARARRLPRGQHQPLPLRPVRPRAGVHAELRRRHRAHDPAGGSRVGRRRLPRAGAERRRLLHAARGLLRPGPRDLRPLRRAADLRRGHLRLRSARAPGSAASASATSPT